MRVFVAFDIRVGILHHQKFQLLQGFADTRGVGHGGHGIGSDQPQPLDLPGLDSRKNVGLKQTALLGEKFRVDAPVTRNLFAIFFFLQHPVTGKARARRPLTRTHGVALAGDGQRAAPRFADVASDKVEVINRHHPVRTVRGLIDAHGPDGHGGASLGIKARHMTNGVFVDATNLRGRDRIVLLDQGLEGLVAIGVRINIGLVVQAFLQDHMGQAVEQHQVGAGRNGQMHVGHLREHGDARVNHDHRELAFLERLVQAPVNDRVLLREVGAEGEQAFGVFEIVVAAGRAIAAEGTLIAGRRRGHAQRGVAVVVVGADHAACELAEGIELLGHDLAGGNHGKAVASVFILDTLDLGGGLVERRVPACFAKWFVEALAH